MDNTLRTSSYLFPILSGVLLMLTLPYVGAYPFAFIALLPLLYFADNTAVSFGKLFWGTILMGLIYVAAVIYPLWEIAGTWWVPGESVLGDQAPMLMYHGGLVLIAFFSSLFFLPFAFFVRAFAERRPALLLAPFVFVLCEWLRTHALMGYSWGVLGYALIDTEHLRIAGEWGRSLGVHAVYLLSFITVAANVLCFDLLRVFSGRAGNIFRRIWNTIFVIVTDPIEHSAAIVFALVLFSVLAFGYAHKEAPARGTGLPVALIASELSPEEGIGEGAYRYFRERIIAALDSGARLVVLPENALPFFELKESDRTLNEESYIAFADRDALYADFLSLSKAHPDVVIALGMHTIGSDGSRYNSLLYYQDGEVAAIYHKRRLVPFFEYLPQGIALPIIERLTAGAPEQYAAIFGIKSGALLCSEIADPSLQNDAPLIVSSSNDGVFTSGTAGSMQSALARMRALEHGAYLLRATKNGISAIIDPRGNVLASTGEGVVYATLPLSPL